ncbi:hypothetical protein [Mesorhizobium sp. M1393]|uniref:hypothetical protein n=1 Tax=Mesorhizobium sp. M1393 TaxID=2957094 RepID=UPI003334C324
MKGSIPYRGLVGVAGGEVAGARISPPAAAASGYDDLEISSCLDRRCEHEPYRC